MESPDLLLDAPQCGGVALPASPFVANQYHFGMLLGVADLQAEQAYHRGKQWLHNAWLHGPGTVWGLAVGMRAEANEVTVAPGLALDAHGRELRVDQELCVDIGRWFVERRPDDLEVTDNGDGTVTFDVHVELAHEGCLDRPVPSISEPCAGATTDTAYSRSIERGLPRIVAGHAPQERTDRYPLLQQFVGQAPVVDDLVTEALADVAAATDEDRPAVCLRWFRRLAAADTMTLVPDEGALAWSPEGGDGAIPLADLVITLREDGDQFELVEADDASTIDNLIRPSHVRTRTSQELVCHLPF